MLWRQEQAWSLLLLVVRICLLAQQALTLPSPHRLQYPDSYFKEPSGVFNPAAVFNSDVGWVLVSRWDQCFYRRCGVHHTGTTALISLCGQDAAAPNVDAAATNFSQWSFEHGKLETMLAQNSANFVSAADLRLFNHKNEVYAGHWLKFGWSDSGVPAQHKCWSDGWGDRHSCEYSAVSKLNFAAQQLEPVYQFQLPILGSVQRPEKNWAFVEQGSTLLIIYTMLPCTSVYVFDPASMRGARLQKGLCYGQQHEVFNATGLKLHASRLSGNPVLWSPLDGSPEQLLAMVHVRMGRNYAHWLLRLDPDSLVITHISTEPVIQSRSYHLEGYFKGVLTVGSFHVIQHEGEQMLWMLLGEGDQYAAWEEAPLAEIDWYKTAKPKVFIDEDGILGFTQRRFTRRALDNADAGQ